MSEEPIICVDNIFKSYIMGREAVEALRGVSLCVEKGEIVCLMGPSGSGKTTLLNILGGLDAPSRGHVVVDGDNVVALDEESLAKMRLRKMGFVFQAYNLLGNFTAEENVEVPMVLAGMKNGERKKRVKELVTMVGLADRGHHYPSELSGGQQQRVAIARAMANDPAILVGDEMTGDLDSVTGFEIMELVAKLNRERGTTVVYVTHDPRMSKYAHRCIQLRDGRIVSSDDCNGTGAVVAAGAEGLVLSTEGKVIVDRGKR
jgi:putative ABC transport system ATP-binding protein